MVSDIEVKDTIVDAIASCNDVIAQFDQVEKILGNIENQLKDKSWAGIAHKKCEHINEAISIYSKSIRPLCEDIKRNSNELKENTEAFYDESSNIQMLKNW